MPVKTKKEQIDFEITTNTEEILKKFDDGFKGASKTIQNSILKGMELTTKQTEEIVKHINEGNEVLKKSFEFHKDINEALRQKNALTERESKKLTTIRKNTSELTKSLYERIKAGDLESKEYVAIETSLKEILKKNKKIVENSHDKAEVQKLLEGFDKKTIKLKEKELKLEKRKTQEDKRQLILSKLESKGVAQGPLGFFRRRKVSREAAGMGPGIPEKAFSKIGKSVKALPGLFNKITSSIVTLLPSLAIFTGSFMAFGAALLYAQKKIFDAQREIIAMAGETGELNKEILKTGKGISVAGSKIDIWRKKTESYVNIFGLGIDEARQHVGEVVKAGYAISETFERVGKTGTDNFSAIYAQSVLAGKEFGEMTSIVGGLREEFGTSLSESTDALVQFRKNATESGITTSRFFDKVVNVASGLGIYGTKIGEVSQGFADLSKNMRLPEKAATEAAANMVGGFKDLSTEQQVLIAQTTKYGNNLMGLIESGTDLKALEKMGIDKDELKRLQSITDPLNRSIQAMRSLAPAEQFKARFEALTKAAGVPIDINDTSIDRIDDVMQRSTYQLEKAGETVGFSREDVKAIQSMTQGLAENAAASALLAEQTRETDLEKQLKKANSSVVEEIRQKFPEVAKDINAEITRLDKQIIGSDGETRKRLNAQRKELEKSYIKQIQTSDKNFADLGNLEERLENERKKEEDSKQAQRLRLQTRSIYDALEQNIAKLLNNIYDAVAPIVITLKRLLTPLGLGLKKLGMTIVEGIAWAFEQIPGLKKAGVKMKEWALKGKLEIQTDEVENDIATLNADLEEHRKTVRAAGRDVSRLTDKQDELAKTGKKLSRSDARLLADAKKIKNESEKEDKRLLNEIALKEELLTTTKKNEAVMKKMISDSPEKVSEYLKNEDLIRKKREEAEKKAAKKPRPIGIGTYADFFEEQFSSLLPGKVKSAADLKAEAESLEQRQKELTGATPATPVEFNLKETGKLVENSPVEFKLAEPGLLNFEKKGINTLEPIVPGTEQAESKAAAGKVINDNRVVNINVNQRDKDYITQVVREAIYTDKM